MFFRYIQYLLRWICFTVFPKLAEKEARKLISSKNEENQQLGRLYLMDAQWKQRKFAEAEHTFSEAVRYYVTHNHSSMILQATNAIRIAVFYKNKLRVKGDELENAQGYALIAYRIAIKEKLSEIIELIELDFPEIISQKESEEFVY